MASKPNKKSTRKVKSLKVQSVKSESAKRVKGGPSGGPWRKNALTSPQ